MLSQQAPSSMRGSALWLQLSWGILDVAPAQRLVALVQRVVAPAQLLNDDVAPALRTVAVAQRVVALAQR